MAGKKRRNHHAVGAWQRKAGPHGGGRRPPASDEALAYETMIRSLEHQRDRAEARLAAAREELASVRAELDAITARLRRIADDRGILKPAQEVARILLGAYE